MFCPLSGQRIQMCKILTLSMIPIIALVVLCSVQLYNTHDQLKEYAAVRANVEFSIELGELVYRLQRERDMTALHLLLSGTDTAILLRERYIKMSMYDDDYLISFEKYLIIKGL